ncbi:MAG: hypothetical protein J7L10_00920 [Methanomicrobia archaeon]|nr:hypothetical protein [Methanomicrobia archaeon]RLF94812.1 MAG: hypothetical protein DRN45_02585 [Thermococci archaeon]RLF95580.1 MAG: hypothetical protein DRN50_03530 [Thermococci archaeon]
MITSGEGKYRVWLKEKKIGDDRLYILGGGEKTHIGGIVICGPKKTDVIRIEGHYDDIVLKPIAEKACEKYKTTIVVIGGVHIENAKKEEIDKIVKNCRSMISCI